MQQNCASLAVLQKGTQLSLVLVITAQHEWPDSNVLCVPKEGACEELLGISPYPWKYHICHLHLITSSFNTFRCLLVKSGLLNLFWTFKMWKGNGSVLCCILIDTFIKDLSLFCYSLVPIRGHIPINSHASRH